MRETLRKMNNAPMWAGLAAAAAAVVAAGYVASLPKGERRATLAKQGQELLDKFDEHVLPHVEGVKPVERARTAATWMINRLTPTDYRPTTAAPRHSLGEAVLEPVSVETPVAEF